MSLCQLKNVELGAPSTFCSCTFIIVTNNTLVDPGYIFSLDLDKTKS